MLTAHAIWFGLENSAGGMINPILGQTVPSGGASPARSLRNWLVVIRLVTIRVIALSDKSWSYESRVIVAQKVFIGDGLLRMVWIEAHFHKILPACPAQHGRADCASTMGTAFRAVRDQMPACRIHAEPDVIKAVEEAVQLRSQERRIVVISNAADQKIGFN